MNDIEKILMETAEKVMKEHCTKEMINEAERGTFPKSFWQEMEDMGITKVGVPEEAGGTGFRYKDGLNILRIAGKYSAPVPLGETLIGNWFLHELGMKTASGILTVAPVTYSNEISVNRTEDGKKYQLSGTAGRVPFARYADNVLLLGKNAEDGSPMLIIAASGEAKITPGINLAGEARDDITLDGLTVDSDRCKQVSETNVARLQDLYALSRIVLMAGSMERVLELTIRYSREREQFGRPIGKFQAIRQQMAVLAGQVASSSIAADYAIDAMENKKDIRSEVAIAKVRIGEATDIAASIAHQVHGAIGFTHEHPLHHCTRRLWSWREEGGSEAEWGKFLGNYVLHHFERPFWDFITASN